MDEESADTASVDNKIDNYISASQHAVDLINEKVEIINLYLKKKSYDQDATQMKKKKERFLETSGEILISEVSSDIDKQLLAAENVIKQNVEDYGDNLGSSSQDDDKLVSAVNLSNINQKQAEELLKQLKKDNDNITKEQINAYFISRQDVIKRYQEVMDKRKLIEDPHITSTNGNHSSTISQASHTDQEVNNTKTHLNETQQAVNSNSVVGTEFNAEVKTQASDGQTLIQPTNNIGESQTQNFQVHHFKKSVEDTSKDGDYTQKKKKKQDSTSSRQYGFALVSEPDKKEQKNIKTEPTSAKISDYKVIAPKASDSINNNLTKNKISDSTKAASPNIQIGTQAKIIPPATNKASAPTKYINNPKINLSLKLKNYVAVIDTIKPSERFFAPTKFNWKNNKKWVGARTPRGTWFLLTQVISFPMEQFGIVLSLLLRFRIFYFLLWMITSIDFIRSWAKLYCVFFARNIPVIVKEYEDTLAHNQKSAKRKLKSQKKNFYRMIFHPAYNFQSFSNAFNRRWLKNSEQTGETKKVFDDKSAFKLTYLVIKRIVSIFSLFFSGVIKMFIL